MDWQVMILGTLVFIVNWFFFGFLAYGIRKGIYKNQYADDDAKSWRQRSKEEIQRWMGSEWYKYWSQYWHTKENEADCRFYFFLGLPGFLICLVILGVVFCAAAVKGFMSLGGDDTKIWGFCVRMPDEYKEKRS